MGKIVLVWLTGVAWHLPDTETVLLLSGQGEISKKKVPNPTSKT